MHSAQSDTNRDRNRGQECGSGAIPVNPVSVSHPAPAKRSQHATCEREPIRQRMAQCTLSRAPDVGLTQNRRVAISASQLLSEGSQTYRGHRQSDAIAPKRTWSVV
jgi:hypothetical protein